MRNRLKGLGIVVTAAVLAALWCWPGVPSGLRVTGSFVAGVLLGLTFRWPEVLGGTLVAFAIAAGYAANTGRSAEVSAATTAYRALVALTGVAVGAVTGWLVRGRRAG